MGKCAFNQEAQEGDGLLQGEESKGETDEQPDVENNAEPIAESEANQISVDAPTETGISSAEVTVDTSADGTDGSGK